MNFAIRITSLMSMLLMLTACPFGGGGAAPKPPFNPVYGGNGCPMPPGADPNSMSCDFYKELQKCLVQTCNLTCDVPCKTEYCNNDGDFDDKADAKKQLCVRGCKPGAPFPTYGSYKVGLVYCPSHFDPPVSSCSDYTTRGDDGKPMKMAMKLRGATSGPELSIKTVASVSDDEIMDMLDFRNVDTGNPLDDGDFCSMPAPTPDMTSVAATPPP